MEIDPSFSDRQVTGKKATFLSINKPQCFYNLATVFYFEKSSPVRLVVFNKLNFKKYQKYL